ncbi:MAG: type II toxin-antitoxin system RelE/ParE family toxin [Deltaproteobacteria bacterium]|nr:type II toxin-antitoxin system RelE/ParE family toxin [Deltaproteobacteria bacterium]
MSRRASGRKSLGGGPRFVVTPAARDDLLEIRDFIAGDDPIAARRVLAKLQAAPRRLAEVPNMGHLRLDLGPEPLRFWQVYSFLIVYRPDARPLEVLRVLHASRDVRRLLEDG